MTTGKGRYLPLTGLLGCCNMKMGDLLLIKCSVFLCPELLSEKKKPNIWSFFVDGFNKDAPKSMDELWDRLKKGGMSFIDKITYYSQRVRGSSFYWRSRQAKLYSWINHHVKEGNGMPNFFITLSCAK
jgi:hypothetical protein